MSSNFVFENWTDCENYPSDKATRREFYWEFVRRNQAYFDAYQQGLHDLTDFFTKWRMVEVLDPRKRFPNAVLAQVIRPVAAVSEEYAYTHTFDVRNPIGPQLEAARKEMEWRREHGDMFVERAHCEGVVDFEDRPLGTLKPKSQRENWTLFLRVLDAKAASASNHEIYDLLEEDKIREPGSREADQWVDNKFQAAKKLRDKKFHKILIG